MTSTLSDVTACAVCGRSVGGGRLGWSAHQKSKAHLAKAGLSPDTVSDFAPDEVSDNERDAMKAALAAAEARALKAEAERDKLNPYVNRPFFTTPEQLIDWYGQEAMLEIAETELAKENKQRMKEGRPGLHLDDPTFYNARITRLIETTAVEMVAEQTKWVDQSATEDLIRMRTLKVVNVHNGVMWQLPIDGTINNASGSLADPLVIYQRKGHKIVYPIRCLLRDCYRPQAVDEHDAATIGGYCQTMHRTVMEGSAEDRGSGRRVTRIDRMARAGV